MTLRVGHVGSCSMRRLYFIVITTDLRPVRALAGVAATVARRTAPSASNQPERAERRPYLPVANALCAGDDFVVLVAKVQRREKRSPPEERRIRPTPWCSELSCSTGGSGAPEPPDEHYNFVPVDWAVMCRTQARQRPTLRTHKLRTK